MIKSMLTIKDPVERLNYAQEVTKAAQNLMDKFILEIGRCTREICFTDTDLARIACDLENLTESDFSLLKQCFDEWCNRLEKQVTVRLLEEEFGDKEGTKQ